MFENYDIETLRTKVEQQTFDRKSVRIDAKGLAVVLSAMANADGGEVVVGIEDDGRVTGIDRNQQHINDLLRGPIDFCIPSIDVKAKYIPCKNELGGDDHVLLLCVEQSNRLHSTTSDEAYLRIGDKFHKLGFEERMQLTFAKGVCYFEDEPVAQATTDDIDMAAVADYCDRIGYKGGAMNYLCANKGFITKKNGYVSGAALLLFAKNPQQWFQRARIRVICFDGTEELTGSRMNVVKDEKFEGRIIDMTRNVIAFVKTQIREHTFLGDGAVFKTVPDYPEFCWTELIVNAIAHRDYSIMGTDIQVKIFSDHLTVESPGILPGMVRLSNIRTTHFSRNPKIANALHDYGFVREFGEGISRIYREMDEAGLPAPVFNQDDFMLRATLSKVDRTVNNNEGLNEGLNEGINEGLNATQKRILSFVSMNSGCSVPEMSTNLSTPSKTIERNISILIAKGYVERRGSKKTGGYYTVADK